MARRTGLGQRGLDILIPAKPSQKKSEGKPGEEKDKAPKKKKSTGKRSSEVSAKENEPEGTFGREESESKKDVTVTDDGKDDSSAEVKEAGTSAVLKKEDASEVLKKEGTSEAQADGQLLVDIHKVEPNRDQPRKQFDEDTLQELADSIKVHGVIQPLIVQKKDDYYEIVAGERRWRAAKIAGLKEIPVLVRDYTDREIMELSLIENIQRQDLNPIEEASAYKRLIEEYSLTQDEVAERVSKSRAAVTNALRLLKLDPRVQDMLVNEMLSTGHVRALLAIEDGDLQFQTAQKAFDEKMSVREVESYVKKLLKNPAPVKPPVISQQLQTIYNDMEERMKASLRTKVSIQSKTPEKGKIEIEYYSSDELERIYNAILAGETE